MFEGRCYVLRRRCQRQKRARANDIGKSVIRLLTDSKKVNHDRIKQQQTVVKESENMITIAQNQTTKMINDLEQFIRSMESGGRNVLTSEITEFLVKLSAFTPKSDQQTRDIKRLTCLLTTFGAEGDGAKTPFC